MIRKKILLIGDFAVGKTSLIRRFVDNAFDDNYLTTIGVKISKKCVTLDGSTESELLIWDIEGATPAKRIPSNYFKGASGAIFVCDVKKKETIKGLQEHIDSFMSVNKDAKYVIAYNKADLMTEMEKESQDLPENVFLTSAKKGENVEMIFSSLVRKMLR